MLNREIEKKIKDHESVASNLQQQVNNLVLQAGNPDTSSAEIVQARGEYSVLNDRLNAIDNTINTEKTNILKEIKDEFNPAKEEVEKSKVDYFGTEHNNLQERLNEDFDNVHQKLNESSLLPYEGTNITADNSYYGLIKDLSIKGRTLQNIVKKIDNHADTTIDGENAFTINFPLETTLHYRVPLLYGSLAKPSTTYTIIYDYETNIIADGNRYINKIDCYEKYISIDNGSVYGKSTIPLSSDGSVQKGKVKMSFKTTSVINESGAKAFEISIINKSALQQEGAYFKATNIMILEGDYENTPFSDLPFIEGIKSVGENEVTEDGNYKVSAKSCGKNLFDGRLELGAINSTTGLDQVSEKSTRNIGYIKVKPNTKYTISRDGTTDTLALLFYDSNLNFISDMSASIVANSNKVVFDTKNSSWIRFVQCNVADVNMMIQVEEGTVATDFEPYQEYKQEITLKEPLRSLPNGVCDTIEGNKVIRRIGKLVLSGKEGWKVYSRNPNITFENTISFESTILTSITKEIFNDNKDNINLYCDKFPTTVTYSYDKEGVFTKGAIRISILTSKLSSQDSTGFKTWLSQNPTTVYYELATPVEESIEKPQLFSQDGTTHIFSDNLLPPTISCSIPSNVPAVVSSLRVENEELQKENTALTEQIEENNIINIETSLEQDARLTMLELGVN